MPSVMISCGEASGDLYAGALVQQLRLLEPAVRVTGFGGERMRAAGAELVGEYRGLTVTGLVEALRVLPKAWRMQQALVARARAKRPDALVLIDFPDFNLRLAGALHKMGVPIVYYVCPQVWAWRRGRLKALKRLLDKALVIFPFEAEVYRDAGIPVEFVGHPLLDLARATQPRDVFLRDIGLAPDAPTIALLPGSRPNELRTILPTLVDAVPLLTARLPRAQFIVARAPNLADDLFAPVTAIPAGTPAVTVEGRADDVLAAADVVLTASGTATVQAAMHECPMVIVYRVAPLTYRLGKPFVTVSTYGMVNLVAGEPVVPELIQDDFTAAAVAEAALRYFEDPAYAEATRARLRDVRGRLGSTGASRRAAEQVLEVCARAGKPSTT